MAMAQISFPTETFTLANISLASLKAAVNTNGLMATFILACFLMALSTAKGNGGNTLNMKDPKLTTMKVTTSTTRKTVKVFSSGKVAMFTKDNT